MEVVGGQKKTPDTKVGRYAFEGDEERASQELKAPFRLKHRVSGAEGLLTYLLFAK
ncbi:MAG: hypothetical protein WCE90_04620 [Candidatus Zixiibacteriota bacterium]